MATATAAPATRWAREYETIYILRPDVDHDTAEKVVGRARDVVQRLGGTLTKLDNWGKRRLAYPIQKNTRGIFVYLKYVGFSDLVAELERNLRLLDEVVRFQTVLLEEDIDPATVEVDPEEVQYLQVEEEDEPEDLETERARSLGMLPRAPREEGPRMEQAAADTGAATEAGAEAGAAVAPAPEAVSVDAAPEATESSLSPTDAEAPDAPDASDASDAPEASDAPDASDASDDKPEGGA